MKKSYPSLGSMGIVTDIKLVMDSIFSRYLTNVPSQSIIDRSRVVSFSKTFKNYSNKHEKFVDQVKTDLETLYNEYFDRVTVDVDFLSYKQEDNSVSIAIKLNVFENGRNFDLNRTLSDISSTTIGMFGDNNDYI